MEGGRAAKWSETSRRAQTVGQIENRKGTIELRLKCLRFACVPSGPAVGVAPFSLLHELAVRVQEGLKGGSRRLICRPYRCISMAKDAWPLFSQCI